MIGPPGSGKTTLLYTLRNAYQQVFHRSIKLVNLDPSNISDKTQEQIYDFDIIDYINTFDVQEIKKYGPNGSILQTYNIFSDKYLQSLDQFLQNLQQTFILIDLPGQVELYTTQFDQFDKIIKTIKNRSLDVLTLALTDSCVINTFQKYLSSNISLAIMQTKIETPFINVINKTDLVENVQNLYEQLQDQINIESLQEDNLVDNLCQFSKQMDVQHFFSSSYNSKQIGRLILLIDDRFGYQSGEYEEFQNISIEEFNSIKKWVQDCYND